MIRTVINLFLKENVISLEIPQSLKVKTGVTGHCSDYPEYP